MTQTFSEWLTHYAQAMCLKDAGTLADDRTLIVYDVVCTFVHPCDAQYDMAAVLLDAGAISTAADDELAHTALSRNLENFLLGAPQFFINPDSRHLVLAQKFAFADTDPTTFSPVLEALALQAKAWQDARSSAW